ncbi:hypothetical protein L3Q82_000750 [Scortum barcoo]|uniref:Uncharacterized protein n=1 Tax=Scortum barcoo TaxID=214431 RepID=A0ACB8WD11_9TELE|nr:hypothetical protein L3Q82_000750 [Scortum barcoo]
MPSALSAPICSYVRLASPEKFSGDSVFQWTPKAKEAFRRLKELFTTAPILTVPDPALQFTVEEDASNEGVGAVLSQRSATDNRIHPCAFLSRKLTLAERNYDSHGMSSVNLLSNGLNLSKPSRVGHVRGETGSIDA